MTILPMQQAGHGPLVDRVRRSNDRSVQDFEGRISALVIGDVMLDRRVGGRVDRISPEAPVPVMKVERESGCLGGAGHVAASLAALGCRVSLAGIVGDDRDGQTLRKLVQQCPRMTDKLLTDETVLTTCKTRIVAGAYQQLARLDYESPRDAFGEGAARLEEQALAELAQYDVVVLADYDKGALPEDVLLSVIASCRQAGVPCLVDGKKQDFSSYARATLLAPNLLEVERAVGRPIRSEQELAAIAAKLRERLALDYMVVTRGPEGMTVAGREELEHIPAKAREVADVTGAGDTVAAVLAACLADHWPIGPACQLSVLAAGIAVSKPGTYVVSAAELHSVHRGASHKLVDWAGAQKLIEAAKQAGRRVVFTNGCFDILHAGHLSCLERARALGDFLVVGLNSDLSVRANKGPARPVISQDYRAALLAGLACVDLIVIFDEERPEQLVRCLAPDVLAKGSDYANQPIAGAEFVISQGGQVVTLPLEPGLSTTRILSASRAGG
ncbi:MAG TPA: bifunctional heptose 7-phosphate kinase/heptose 1-phosphate adenyltransferase [Pirellulales bacterium]|nr:bifunctional heptose 7-phosphate kinase/heptose 1-phosphate adenyltransferase [Pirellulales bacterium]